jgi:hypothetical protein
MLHIGLTIHHQRPLHFLPPTSKRPQIFVSEYLPWFVPPEIFVAAVLPAHSPKNQQIPISYVQQQFGTKLRDSGKSQAIRSIRRKAENKYVQVQRINFVCKFRTSSF